MASCFTILLVVISLKYIEIKGIVLALALAFLILADGIIIGLAPLENKNRKLDNAEKGYFRKKSMLILAVENMFLLLFLVIPKYEYVLPIVAAVLCQAGLLLIAKLENP